MAKIIKMEPGTFAWQIAGIINELDKWQCFNYETKEWISAKNYCMFHFPLAKKKKFRSIDDPFEVTCEKDYSCELVLSFNELLENYAKTLPEEAFIYAYDSNETFGVLRPNFLDK